jgi:2-dehydro-3-deoxygalactonokinase
MIAIDWGTTSLRATRLDAHGAVMGQRRSAQGIRAAEGRFAEVLREEIEGWDDALVVMAGMVGSRQGWFEMPYVACPAGAAGIAQAMQRVPVREFPDREIWLVPGLQAMHEGVPDVMRGEEAQLCGVLAQLPAQRTIVLLPGTHSKRAVIEGGRITGFATAMTGELFELLCAHSLLGKLMQPGIFDAAAFARGVAHAARAGDLLAHLFATRTLGLFGLLAPEQSHSFLSGLLIGHELDDLPADAGTLHLVGAPALLVAYEKALALRGHGVRIHDESASAQGLFLLAQQRGLLDGP